MNWRATLQTVFRAFGLSTLAAAFVRGDDAQGGLMALTRPYAQSTWVMAAISSVTRPMLGLSLKFYLGDVEAPKPELATFWKSPAKNLSQAEFIEALGGWYKLAGEFFVIMDDAFLRPSSALQSKLIVPRPQDMRHIVTDGILEGWELRDASGKTHFLLPEDVIHEKRWNPYNQFRGLGELEGALLAADTDFKAGKYANAAFSNMGDHGDYIVAKGAVPNDDQRAQITEALREKRTARMRGIFKPVFLGGDLEIKSPQVTAPDQAFVLNRVSNRHEIFAAFGVPMSMADVQASYSIGSASDYFRLIIDTAMPLSTKIVGAMDRVLERLTGSDKLTAYLDWDEHPVIQAVRRERVDSAEKLWGMGVPLKTVNDYLDMGLPAFAGWEKSYLPFSVAEQGSVDDPKEDPTLAEPEVEDSVQQMVKALNIGCQACARDTDGVPFVSSVTGRDAQRLALWKSHVAKRRKSVKAYESKFRKVLMEARSECLANLDKQKGLTGKAVAGDIVFDLSAFKNALLGAMRKCAIAALTEAGKELFQELSKDDPFTMPPAKAMEFLTVRENRMSDVADDVFAKVKASIQQSLLDGDSIDQIAGKIRGTFNELSKSRSTTVAMTETAAAYGVSRDEAMKQAGVQYKQWLTSGNGNVRASHMEAEGQIVPIDEPFQIGNSELMFPGDPSGPASEVINCHCVQIASAYSEQE